MTATLKVVAQACGVDVSTVSRALRGDPRVAARTVEQIQAMAERLGYRPNLPARALQAGATRTVMFLAGSLAAVMDRNLAIEAGQVVEAGGYDLLFMFHRNEPATYERLLARLEQGLADAAMILPGTWPHSDSPWLRTLVQRRYPLIFLDRSPGWANVPTVTTDNDGTTRELVRRLAAAGTRRLVVCEEGRNDVATTRREAAVDEAGRLGIDCRRDPQADDAWLAAGAGPLGVFATGQDMIHDLCTRHAEVLRGTELRFACFDGWTGEPYPAPLALVAIQDFPAMARCAANRVLATIADRSRWSGTVDRLPPLRIDEIRAKL